MRIPTTCSLIICVLIMLTSAFRISSARASESRKAPAISILRNEASIGECIAGTTVRVSYDIRNTGDADLSVTNVGASCGCLAPERSWPERLGPGESGTIKLTIDTWAFSGRVKKPLTVFCNDPNQPRATLWLTGQVEKVLELKPAMVQFGLCGPNDDPEQRVATIRNVTKAALTLVNVRSGTDRFVPKLTEAAPGKEWKLTVRARPPFAYGTNAATITIQTDHPKAKTFELSAILYCPPPLQVIPPRIILPAEALKRPLNRALYLRTRSQEGWKLDDVTCSDGRVRTTTRPGRKKTDLPRVTLAFPEGYRATAESSPEVVLKLSRGTKADTQVTLRVPIQAAGQTRR